MSDYGHAAASRVHNSLARFEQALQQIPGGTQLVSRRPTQYAYGASPIYAVRAQGARFWDVDGHEYIDWASGIGSIILGYADPVVDEAVTKRIRDGTVYSINHELEVQLAELLVERIPCAEMVRYAKGGGEACAIAIRIARGVTGRDKILCCGYHGWHDWYLAANLASDETLANHLFSGIEAIGVPSGLQGTALPFPYGDAAALAQLLDQHRGDVAAVIMEPMRGEYPREGYLRDVRELASRHGVVLIFDEVSTGFRPSDGGVQPIVGVEPDMAVFAKSISNGYPMAAVVGRREVMEPAARMFISSTYWSDTIGLQAAWTTLQELRARRVPAYLGQLGATLKKQLTTIAADAGLAATCTGVDHHPHLHFDVPDADSQREVHTLYIQEMAKRGCHGYAAFYLNAAQGEAELAQTLDAAREVLPLIAKAIDEDAIDRLLECQVRRDAFRRLVR